MWVGGGLQHFAGKRGDQLGAGRFASVVYGFRPKPLRVEAHKPMRGCLWRRPLRTGQPDRWPEFDKPTGAGPCSSARRPLILYKAFAFEAGVLFPAYQRVDAGRSKERLRVAVNVSYFFWLK